MDYMIVWKIAGDKLVCDAGASAGPPAWIEGSKGHTFPKGGGLPGRAWASGGTVEFTPNVQTLDAGAYMRLDLAKQCGIKGSAAVLKGDAVIECGCSSELSSPPAL